jgi:Fe2+ transport system protein FeoA
MTIAEAGTIAQRQPGAEITYKLWALGLGPGDSFEIKETGEDYIIAIKDAVVNIPAELARQISVEKEI